MDTRPPQVQRRSALRVTHQKFQIAFLLFCFGVGIVTTATAVIAMQMMVYGLADSIANVREMNWDQIEATLQAESHRATLLIVAVAIVNLVFTGLMAFLFSQRVGGIVLRLTNTLRLWSDGKQVSQIIPRDGDYFVELVDQVNEVIKNPKP